MRIILYRRNRNYKKRKERQKNTPGNVYGTHREHRPPTVRAMKVLTVKEAAELLKVKPQWVYAMLREGGLPFIRLGRQIRIDEASLEKWLVEHRSAA